MRTKPSDKAHGRTFAMTKIQEKIDDHGVIRAMSPISAESAA
jgi:hypothetical protein